MNTIAPADVTAVNTTSKSRVRFMKLTAAVTSLASTIDALHRAIR